MNLEWAIALEALAVFHDDQNRDLGHGQPSMNYANCATGLQGHCLVAARSVKELPHHVLRKLCFAHHVELKARLMVHLQLVHGEDHQEIWGREGSLGAEIRWARHSIADFRYFSEHNRR